MNERDGWLRVLELTPDASPDEVRRAWIELCKVWHPDRFEGDPGLQRRAEQKLKQINDAYGRLSHQGVRPGPETVAPIAQAMPLEGVANRREGEGTSKGLPPTVTRATRRESWAWAFVGLGGVTFAVVIVAIATGKLLPKGPSGLATSVVQEESFPLTDLQALRTSFNFHKTSYGAWEASATVENASNWSITGMDLQIDTRVCSLGISVWLPPGQIKTYDTNSFGCPFEPPVFSWRLVNVRGYPPTQP